MEDSAQSYSLYLPDHYHDSILWPVIYIFEPAARADLPVTKYAPLARQYGYILACSWNSRNGSWDIIINAANAMIPDTWQRFSVDTQRVFTMGFSGGARAACTMAMATGRIDGVIGCGAGFPTSVTPQPHHDFNWIGITGYEDPNYLEMLKVDDALSQPGIRHNLLFFDGNHEWPPEEVMETAFQWIDMIRKGESGTKSKTLSVSEITGKLQGFNIYPPGVSPDPFLAYHRMAGIRAFFPESPESDSITQKMDSLINTGSFRQRKTAYETGLKYEEEKQKEYLEELLHIGLLSLDPDHDVRSSNWWQRQFNQLSGDDKDSSHRRLIDRRLAGFIQINAWEQSAEYEALEMYDIAIRYMSICEMALPEQYWPIVKLFDLYIQAGKENKAFKKLDRAIEMGFSNTAYLRKQGYFNRIMTDKRFNELIQQMENNEKAATPNEWN